MTADRLTRARVTLALSILLAFLATTGAAVAQQAATTAPTGAAAIVAQFPAESGAKRDEFAAQILKLGEPGIAAITATLVPPDTGGDTPARWALNAVAVYASRAGAAAEPQRALAERAFVAAFTRATDVEVRTFLLRQLRIVGREAAVKAATPFLTDADLSEPATQLMLQVRSLSAKAAVAAALAKTPQDKPAILATLAKAAGELKAAESHDALVTISKSPDPRLRRPAFNALARLGSPRSATVFAEAAKSVDYRFEPANTMGAALEYAKQLAARGNVAAAQKFCRAIMTATDDDERRPVMTAALTVLVSTLGPGAQTELMKAVDHADPEYRAAALRLALKRDGPGFAAPWVAKAKKTDAVRRAEIIRILSRSKDRAGLAYIKASLGAAEPEVAITAAEALAHVEGAKAVPDLLNAFKASTGDATTGLAGVLQWTIDEKHLDPLAAMLDTLPVPAKAAAIGVIGAKNGQRFASRIMPLTGDTNPEIKAAALGALAGVAAPSDLPALLGMLDKAEGDVVAPVQKAVVAAALRTMPEAGRAAPLVQAIKTSPHPERIVELLAQVGGKDALAAAAEQFASPSTDMKAAAFRALSRWPGIEAADQLFAIFAGGNEAYRNQAFSGYVRQISSSTLTPEQKLLLLRKALDKASTSGDRRILVRAFERIKTFQSFLLVSRLLDDPDIGSEAAGAAARIALPTPGSKDGLSGTLVRAALEKALTVIKGSQAEADKESIRSYLATMPQDEGFVSIFNGKDLTGWKGLVENPIKRAAMSAQELAAKQVEADTKARTTWTVRDGQIVFNGTGDNLCTVKEYGDIEMIVDWRITKGGDSGIYLRGTPQVQIWDTARVDVGAQVGSGGLYNNQKNVSKPLVVADNPVGEWNTLHITMIGDKVTVFLNGIKVVDNVTMENYWDRKAPLFPRGQIELQAHGTDLAFRDIYVRELK
jgi:hypothetical protein